MPLWSLPVLRPLLAAFGREQKSPPTRHQNLDGELYGDVYDLH